MTFSNIKIKNTAPITPNPYLRNGWMSCSKFPRDNVANIIPVIGIGIFLMIFMAL